MSDAGLSTPDRDQRIAALEALLAERDAALADARAQLHSRDLLIQTLRAKLAKLRHMQFGHSSEKLSRQIEQLELTLEELEAEAIAATPDRTAPLSPERLPPVRAFPPHLPREEVVHEPATGACACPSCGGVLRPLGRDADELLDVAPVSWRVVRHVRPKYSCRSCERIVQAPTPAKAIAKGRATFATLAHVVVSKFDHHLPLYRQAEMMAAQGVDLDRSTLAGWTGQAAALLDPIVSRIREQGLKAGKLHTDDTPVPVLKPGHGKTVQGRLWIYAADDRGCGAATPPLVWYRFTPDRSGVHPQRELAGFSGHLQADAYAGYKKLFGTGRVTEVACWAHFRRGIFDEHRGEPTALTTDLLDRIRQLYVIEASVRGKPPDARARARQEHAKPVVDALRDVIDDALRKLSPRSDMAKALRYGVKLWPALTRYLDDGRLEIDNGVAERALRGVAVGRRNWLFAGSIAGGERAAALYTVIETAKANGVEPQAYIADVLAKVAGGWPAARWDELMPWNWRTEPAKARSMTQETIARLRIGLEDIRPEIWRTVDMPVAGSLKMLHDVIQAAMGWRDYHLWHFEAGDRRYGVPDPEWPDSNLAAARNVKLGALIERGVRELNYIYDMGDDWRHTVTIEAVELGQPGVKYPRFVAGERRCPPEDVGGFPGFELFLDAMRDPAHEEHQHLQKWYGGPFDPEDIDELATKRAVAAIAIRRHAGKAAYEKSRTRH